MSLERSVRRNRSNVATALAAAALVGVIGLAGGCGGSSGQAGVKEPMGDMSGMSAAEMEQMDDGPGPSSSARMICSDEIKDSVKRTFALDAPAPSDHTWKHGVYTCDYHLAGGGDLRLTVHDATDPAQGKVDFATLRTDLGQTEPIAGMENFGLPGYETEAGDVVFIKDGKTLHVDATDVSSSDLPAGFDRQGVAYSVAASVIACWTE